MVESGREDDDDDDDDGSDLCQLCASETLICDLCCCAGSIIIDALRR